MSSLSERLARSRPSIVNGGAGCDGHSAETKEAPAACVWSFDKDANDHGQHLNKVTALLDTNGPDHRDDEQRAYQTL